MPNGQLGYPKVSLYSDGATRLDIRDAFTHEPLAIATANCVTYCPPDCIIVKDYSENEGMADALLKAGFVTELVIKLDAGRWGIEYPIMRLNPELAETVKKLREAFFDEEVEG